MTADDYTPSMDEVRNLYVMAIGVSGEYFDAVDEDEARARWDRAIANLKAEVRAEIVMAIRADMTDPWTSKMLHPGMKYAATIAEGTTT